MMGAYRKAKTLGVLENKLLAHTAMRRLGIPVLDVTYGAMAYTNLGEWKRYSRNELYAALRATKLGIERPFVVKPASDGTNFGLLVMQPARWKKENWTEALVARHIERFLYKARLEPTPLDSRSEASGCTRLAPLPECHRQLRHQLRARCDRARRTGLRGGSGTSSVGSSYRRCTPRVRRRCLRGRMAWPSSTYWCAS